MSGGRSLHDTSDTAATRLGLSGATLGKWVTAELRRNHTKRPARRAMRRPPTFYDRIAKARGWMPGAEKLGAAARGTGIPRDKLRARCMIISRGRGAHRLMRREDIDRVAGELVAAEARGRSR